MRRALLPLATVLLALLAGGGWSIWQASSPVEANATGPITGPEMHSAQAVRLVPAPHPSVEAEAPAPAVLLHPAPARVFAPPKDEYFEALSRPFIPPTFEEFQRAIEHKTGDAGLATALWQIPAIRQAYIVNDHVHYVLGFVQDYYSREVTRAHYNLAPVSLAADLGDVMRYLLAHAADRDAMRAALEAFEAGVAVAAHSRDLQAAYDAAAFCLLRDQVEEQIRAIPFGVRALQLLRESVK